jgi:hypothetical protein
MAFAAAAAPRNGKSAAPHRYSARAVDLNVLTGIKARNGVAGILSKCER